MSEQRYEKIKRITLFSAAINAVLALLKIIFGLMGHSHALFADGVHSASDLITDILVLFAAHYGSQAADQDHPYGHGRIETLATAALSLVLCLAGIGIIFDATQQIRLISHPAPAMYVALFALLSVIANEALFRYMNNIAQAIHSDLLAANAWHHRSDAASSLLVLVGVVGSLMGYPYLDGLAAIIVGCLIVKMGLSLAWSSMRELIDTAVDENQFEAFKQTISRVGGVQSVHQLRTRSSNGEVLVDVHVIVDPMLSVSEGHHIGQSVHRELMASYSSIRDVIVHIDPEDDETAAPSEHLPNRQQVLTFLNERWKNEIAFNDIHHLVLHYLNGELHIEVMMAMSLWDRGEQVPLNVRLMKAISDLTHIKSVTVYYSQ